MLLTPTSFLPWWDDAAQRRTFDLIRRLIESFDLIRRLIEILVPFTSPGRDLGTQRDPAGAVPAT
jgi:hypothetical protein